jgi:hypothetical protein
MKRSTNRSKTHSKARSLMVVALLAVGVLGTLFSRDDLAARAAVAAPDTMMVCHDLKPNEKPNMMMMPANPRPMTSTKKHEMMCKSVDMKMMMAGPDMSKAKTTADAFDVWQGFVTTQLGMR